MIHWTTCLSNFTLAAALSLFLFFFPCSIHIQIYYKRNKHQNMVIFYSNSKTCNVLFYVNDYYCYHCVALSVYSASEICFSLESVKVFDFWCFAYYSFISEFCCYFDITLCEWVCLKLCSTFIFVPSSEF